MWHFGMWFGRHDGVGWMVGLDDLRGLFQPVILLFSLCLAILFAHSFLTSCVLLGLGAKCTSTVNECTSPYRAPKKIPCKMPIL